MAKKQYTPEQRKYLTEVITQYYPVMGKYCVKMIDEELAGRKISQMAAIQFAHRIGVKVSIENRKKYRLENQDERKERYEQLPKKVANELRELGKQMKARREKRAREEAERKATIERRKKNRKYQGFVRHASIMCYTPPEA